MGKKEYSAYLRSDEWKLLRAEALERTGGLCQFCSQPANQVHHVKYPKKYGEENIDNLIPVCKKCHELSHGIQGKEQMNSLKNAQLMNEISPTGKPMRYLLSEGKIFASARSWSSALKVPSNMRDWFESGLGRVAIMKKNYTGGSLERSYQGIAVYRWPAVAQQLRVFDRKWFEGSYNSYTKSAKSQIDEFHDNYEKLVDWGYELQERAIENALNPNEGMNVEIEQLKQLMETVTAPVIQDHQVQLDEHTTIISNLDDKVSVIEKNVPKGLDPKQFITIRQAILEKNLDSEEMPFFPQSKENLSGITGQMLSEQGFKSGGKVNARVDGKSLIVQLNSYQRMDIYHILSHIKSLQQGQLEFGD